MGDRYNRIGGYRRATPQLSLCHALGMRVAPGSSQPVYHGMPVDLALARLINQENALDQQAYQASSVARNTQLIQAQNDP